MSSTPWLTTVCDSSSGDSVLSSGLLGFLRTYMNILSGTCTYIFKKWRSKQAFNSLSPPNVLAQRTHWSTIKNKNRKPRPAQNPLFMKCRISCMNTGSICGNLEYLIKITSWPDSQHMVEWQRFTPQITWLTKSCIFLLSNVEGESW